MLLGVVILANGTFQISVAFRYPVPTVLPTGTPILTAAAGGTAHVPVRLLVGPYVMPVRTLVVAGWPVATPGV